MHGGGDFRGKVFHQTFAVSINLHTQNQQLGAGLEAVTGILLLASTRELKSLSTTELWAFRLIASEISVVLTSLVDENLSQSFRDTSSRRFSLPFRFFTINNLMSC